MNTDRIEKKILLRAPRERVWAAISDSAQFGHWFGAVFDGPFVEGARVGVRIAPTQVDPEVAKLQQPYAGIPFEILVERIEPQRRFAFRWHPFAVGVDVSGEPMTLVTFELADGDGGTWLTVTESGFDRLGAERRAQAFPANSEGWNHQSRLIEKYLARPAA